MFKYKYESHVKYNKIMLFVARNVYFVKIIVKIINDI